MNIFSLSKRYLPLFVTLLGLCLTVLTWYFFDKSPVELSVPVVGLVLGAGISCLVGIVLHYFLLSQEHISSLKKMNQEIQNEIQDRIQAEEVKQRLEKEFLQGQKLQAIGTLAGGIAHDFNNLLYAIIGYVEMAREDTPTDCLTYNNLGKVLEAAKRGQELISRILTFSRQQHHEFKPICLQETIEGILGLLKPTIPASVDIQFDAPHQNCIILGNQTLLHQVIVNIINNAVDAMDGEGRVKIKLQHISAHDDFLKHFPETTDSNYCKLEISDTGYGMDLATQERVFEPFFTTKEVGKGTGLGLATVHSIIKEHHGEIAVKSQVGSGTLFTVLLPEYAT